jgi:kinetochore protein Mis13/DSN1
VIVRAPSRSSSSLGDLEHPSLLHDPPPRPPSRHQSQPPEPPSKRFKGDTSSSKGKGREALLGIREDPQVDEDVRQMESEADHLRRKSRAAEDSGGFADPSFKFPSPSNPDARSTRRHQHVDTIQPVNGLETPQQQRNKLLREQGGTRSHGRKSSLTMRGKRISNSYETTGIISMFIVCIVVDLV